MSNERDALEILINVLYLIEQQADKAGTVRSLVRQAAGSVEFLIEHHADPAQALKEAA